MRIKGKITMCKILFLIFFAVTTTVVSTINAYGNERHYLTFSEAANFAVAASADLRHAYASQAVMEGAWRWGLRSYFPRVSINLSENDRLQQFGADSFMKNYSINLDQLVWDGGRTTMSRRLERMELDLSSSRLDRLASEIAESAIAAYRNILSSRAILDIKIAALVVLQEQRRVLSEEVQLGLALGVDLASADISIADARLDIYLLQLDLAEMEKRFAELLGLESLPILGERVDVNRSGSFVQSSFVQNSLAQNNFTQTGFAAQSAVPAAIAAAALAREQNPDIVEARHSIARRQMELKYISRSWIPTLRVSGNFGVSGQNYPLTRYNWSVGLSIELSGPWVQNRFGAQAGWEPSSFGQPDRTAMIQNSITPLPDPAASYGRRQAALALAVEQEKFDTFLEQIGRIASSAVERCILAEQRRVLALEAASLGSERCRIEEIRLSLGHITRLRLMEVLIEQTQREIAVVQAATALLEAERELERFLDLEPGELAKFAAFISRGH